MDLDPLRHSAHMIARIGAIVVAELLPGRQSEGVKALDCDLWADPLNVGHGPLGIASGLVADGGQLRDASLERGITHIDQSILDRLIEPGELGV
ncbi:MAG: hypothetical protein PHE36_13990, partial [Novosphingobium sp.]|nr:hypothetical protein [Novosphingobium sp.]